jgi:hypothetical protein
MKWFLSVPLIRLHTSQLPHFGRLPACPHQQVHRHGLGLAKRRLALAGARLVAARIEPTQNVSELARKSVRAGNAHAAGRAGQQLPYPAAPPAPSRRPSAAVALMERCAATAALALRTPCPAGVRPHPVRKFGIESLQLAHAQMRMLHPLQKTIHTRLHTDRHIRTHPSTPRAVTSRQLRTMSKLHATAGARAAAHLSLRKPAVGYFIACDSKANPGMADACWLGPWLSPPLPGSACDAVACEAGTNAGPASALSTGSGSAAGAAVAAAAVGLAAGSWEPDWLPMSCSARLLHRTASQTYDSQPLKHKWH